MTETQQRNRLIQDQLVEYFLQNNFSKVYTLYREMYLRRGNLVIFFTTQSYRIHKDSTKRSSLEAFYKKSKRIGGTYYKDIVLEGSETLDNDKLDKELRNCLNDG